MDHPAQVSHRTTPCLSRALRRQARLGRSHSRISIKLLVQLFLHIRYSSRLRIFTVWLDFCLGESAPCLSTQAELHERTRLDRTFRTALSPIGSRDRKVTISTQVAIRHVSTTARLLPEWQAERYASVLCYCAAYVASRKSRAKPIRPHSSPHQQRHGNYFRTASGANGPFWLSSFRVVCGRFCRL